MFLSVRVPVCGLPRSHLKFLPCGSFKLLGNPHARLASVCRNISILFHQIYIGLVIIINLVVLVASRCLLKLTWLQKL